MTIDTFKNVEGRNVVAVDTGKSIGSVRGFVLDASGRTIEAIHVDGRRKRATVLNWQAVQAFGADVVMASSAAEASRIDNEHQRAAVSGAVTLLGNRVLSVGGLELGTIVDVEFDNSSGEVVRVATDRDPVAADRFRALGSHALVVDEL